ncbi:MAG: hypothetical protein K0R47_4505 [Brevibacillus sp.]|nr:hypothetical protein [Brevibacillus sp.]
MKPIIPRGNGRLFCVLRGLDFPYDLAEKLVKKMLAIRHLCAETNQYTENYNNGKTGRGEIE